MASDLPGPKKRQAEALFQNIRFLFAQFGVNRIGFLTLTVGDFAWEIATRRKRFVGVRERAEVQRRFHSLRTHFLPEQYRCGVIVTERHKSGCLHFHLVVVCKEDIRTGFDFDRFKQLEDAVRHGKRRNWRASEVGANANLQAEWKAWRDRAPGFKFGRCQVTPAQGSDQALGRYVAKYVLKNFVNRTVADKGGRCLRYFGNWAPELWDNGESYHQNAYHRTPPWTLLHSRLTLRARIYRECCKQVSVLMSIHNGSKLNSENVQDFGGQRWAWHWIKVFNATEFHVPEHLPADLQDGLRELNRTNKSRHSNDLQGLDICAVKPIWERSVFDFERDLDTYDELGRREIDLPLLDVRRGNRRAVELEAGLRGALDGFRTASN